VIRAGELTPKRLSEWYPKNDSPPASPHLLIKIPEAQQDSIRAGDLTSTRCYAHPHFIQDGQYIEINYLLFFPFNGQAFTKFPIINKIFRHYGIGFHEGDFEHITVRLSSDGSQLIGVYYSAHANEDTWITQNIPFDYNNRILSYVALNTHAMYPVAKRIKRRIMAPTWISKDLKLKRVWTPLIDFTSDEGHEIDCRNQLTYLNPNTPEEPEWLTFTGRWGSASRERHSSTGPTTPSYSGWYTEHENPEDGLFRQAIFRVSTPEEIESQKTTSPDLLIGSAVH
jgi:hypothetical protein